MKILIVSDTHKALSTLLDVSNKYKDYIKFDLGDRGIDKKIFEELGYISVDGNCDRESDNLFLVKEIERKRFLLTHGHIFNVKYDLTNLYFKACEEHSNYALYGHTHIQDEFIENNIHFINPGSLKDGHYALIIDDEVILK